MQERSSIVKITHADGELELTPDHVLLVDGQWAAARTVKVCGLRCMPLTLLTPTHTLMERGGVPKRRHPTLVAMRRNSEPSDSTLLMHIEMQPACVYYPAP